ncbi:MAG TPA: SAM-dependent methyltransferase [Labilithrix sp.]|nr:SAM-dependent methyltransferase [Labilithrix sp.]
MPSHLKNRVRARMEKTGESYQQALRHVRAQEARTPSVPEASPAEAKFARSRTVADTAFSIAVVRAEEGSRPEGERLFTDPFAAAFAAAGADAAENTQRFLELPFFRDGIRLRTRFLDDCVRDGLAAGLKQLVLLGAGFDARGLRMTEFKARRATVFEVDTPHQLDRKRRALASAGVKIPAHIVYIPFDFDTHDLESELGGALEIAGFKPGIGAMFVWEGVIGYIDDAMIDQSLRFIAAAGGPRSRLAFTFADEAHLGTEAMAARTKRCGFASFECAAGDELWRRYLPGEPHPNAWVTKVGLATV